MHTAARRCQTLHSRTFRPFDIVGTDSWVHSSGESSRVCRVVPHADAQADALLRQEILQRQSYGAPSDLWSLGCTLYELFTKR